MRGVLCIILLISTAVCLQGGVYEDWIEAADYPEELEEWLADLRLHPLDLNTASVSDLSKLPFMDRATAHAIVHMRRTAGGWRSVADVDTLANLSAAQKASLADFTAVAHDYLALERAVMRNAASVSAKTNEQIESAMAGYRMRADFRTNNGSAGYLFGLRRPRQSDFFEEASFGVELPQEEYRPRLLAGDYQIETGTGLVFATAYGMGSWLSSSDAITVPAARGLACRPTASRLARQRGLAAEYTSGAMTARLCGAINRLDAAISDGETVKITEGTTASDELDAVREDRLEERLVGANAEYMREDYAIGVAAYTADFAPDFSANNPLEPMPRLTESSLRVGSVFTRLTYGSVQALSEAAASGGGGIAHQSALTFQDKRSAWTVYHVYADETFYSPHSRLWGGYGDDAGNTRQTGVRTVLRGQGYQLSLGGSAERTPFRTSTSPLRKSGDRLRALLRVYPGAAVAISGQFERRWNELASALDESILQRIDRSRVEVLFSGREEYKLRLDLKSALRNTGRQHALGTVLLFQVKTTLHGILTVPRIAMWNVEDSDASMSMYESSVYGAYPLVSLYGTGRRFSMLLGRRWDGFRIGAVLGHTVMENLNETSETVDFALEISYRQ